MNIIKSSLLVEVADDSDFFALRNELLVADEECVKLRAERDRL
jgi:hypothetical protein